MEEAPDSTEFEKKLPMHWRRFLEASREPYFRKCLLAIQGEVMRRHIETEDVDHRCELAGQYKLILALLNGQLDQLCKSSLKVSLNQIPEFQDYM